MTIQVKLFGDLKNKTQEKTSVGSPIILTLDNTEITYISDVLKRLNITENEVSHIFVNHRYSGFHKKVENGDLIALFPRNMGLLYKWYFKREEDE
jgi:molybdopterin converting factor small subunit